MTALPPAPGAPVNAAGQIALGAYRGFVGSIDWRAAARAAGRGRIWRALHEKRWHFASVTTDDVVAAFAIIDVGWAASAFAYVFDRRARRLVVDGSWMGAPGAARVTERPGEGGSRFSTWRARLEIDRRGAGWAISARARGLALDAALSETPSSSTLCAIARIDGGVANCTHKSACVSAAGAVEAKGARFALDGGAGFLDHTHGLLARDTRWRWAAASSPEIAFNLVEGFNGPVENALWIDGRLHPVGAAEIRFTDGKPREAWTVRTVDGAVDLAFAPEGARGENKNLIVAVSRYVQPIGAFRGTLRPPGGKPIAVEGLTGVTEDHRARW